MNRITLVLLSIVILSCSCRAKNIKLENQTYTEANEMIKPATDFSEQSTLILGYFTRNRMTNPPHDIWFNKGYENYQCATSAIYKLKEISKDDITIKIVMGSWLWVKIT